MFFYSRNVTVALRFKPIRSHHTILKAMDETILKSKFRGCLMGALLGDCLGAPFEGDPLSRGALKIVQNFFDTLEQSNVKGKYKNFKW